MLAPQKRNPEIPRSDIMADYYTLEQLAEHATISESEIGQLLRQGLLQPTVKNGGLSFLSHRLIVWIRQSVGRGGTNRPSIRNSARLEQRMLAARR